MRTREFSIDLLEDEGMKGCRLTITVIFEYDEPWSFHILNVKNIFLKNKRVGKSYIIININNNFHTRKKIIKRFSKSTVN